MCSDAGNQIVKDRKEFRDRSVLGGDIIKILLHGKYKGKLRSKDKVMERKGQKDD